MLTSDGQMDIALGTGDVVHICASRHTLALARVNPRNHFYATLVSRLIRREQWRHECTERNLIPSRRCAPRYATSDEQSRRTTHIP